MRGDNDHMAQLKLTADILNAALEGYTAQKVLLDNRIAEVRRMLDGSTGRTSSTEVAKPRKKRSAAVRRRMKLAQQLRWKKIKEGGEPPQAESAKPKKRKLSAAGRRAIIDATKKRWARVKAAKKAAA